MRDGEGNVLKRVHPNAYDSCRDDGEGTTYDYDSDGNNIRIHYPDGGCERIFYDSEGNRIRHVMPESYDPQTDDGEGFTYTYDACSRLTAVTGPDGVRQASYAYDLAGNLTEETDAEGRCTYRSYTAFGELKEQLKPALEELPLKVISQYLEWCGLDELWLEKVDAMQGMEIEVEMAI